MRRHLRRLTLAFCLSLLGLILTRHFFGGDGGLYRRGGQEPIAKLEQTLNEVQRKPLGKLVWETVTQGEDLFPGEDIRTSSASSSAPGPDFQDFLKISAAGAAHRCRARNPG